MQKQREHWGTQLGFILAAAGSAIGLGTLWKFPYMTASNGGGLFVLLYLFCTFLIGIPLFIAELILGRKTQRAAVGVFSELSGHATPWRAVGWLGVASSFVIMSYYSTIAGWGLNYILMSLNQVFSGRSPQEVDATFEALKSSWDINLFWHFIFTGITVAVVYKGIREGIEYWSKIMTSTLFVLLILLSIYSCTLAGFGQAVDFILVPHFDQLKPSTIIEALGLAFFTLSLGQGIMLTYGSYMRRTDNIPKAAFIVGFGILCAAIMASLIIFPIIFTYGAEPQAGPGLVFQSLPLLFARLPASTLISTVFFTLFVFAGLTSAIPLIEVVAANLMDLYEIPRKKATVWVGIACFILGIPSALSWSNTVFKDWHAIYGKTFFETMDNLATVWMIPICGFSITIYIGWFLREEMIKEEFFAGTQWKWLWRPWLFLIRYIAPLAMLLIFLQNAGLISIDSLLN